MKSVRSLITAGRFSAAVVLLIGACGSDSVLGPGTVVVDQKWSFESGLEGWGVNATDILVGGQPIEWWIRPSTARAFEGQTSVELFMANYTDAAKIWLVRPFMLQPNRSYTVTISYALASADYGDLNHFALITGVTRTEPKTAMDLTDTFMRNATGNGCPANCGYQWLPKSVTTTATTGADGRLYVNAGIWGTYETARTYFLDALRVVIVAQ